MKTKISIRLLLIMALMLCFLTGILKSGMTYELPKSKYLLLMDKNNTVVEIQDGMNLSRRWLMNARINLQEQTLEGVNFSGADLTGADLRETVFKNCSFKGANLTDVNASETGFVDCDFEDAIISGARFNCLSKEQLITTMNYKNRDLVGVELRWIDFSGLDFSRFHLMDCHLCGNLTGCDFTNASINGYATFPRPRGGATLDSSFDHFLSGEKKRRSS